MKNSKLALITGGSSGIGYSFAKHLSGNSTDLILISRNPDKLNKVKSLLENDSNVRIFVLACNLSDYDSIEKIKTFLDEHSLYPDLLINNAGAGIYGEFSKTNESKELDIIKLNVIGSAFLCKMIIKRMTENSQNGYILNISSSLAFRKSPDWAIYSATKAFVLSFSKTLSFEFKNNKINVSVLCPGKTLSDFDLNAEYKLIKDTKKDSPDDVAFYALKKLYQRKIVIIPGLKNKLIYFIFRYLPDYLTDFLLNKQ